MADKKKPNAPTKSGRAGRKLWKQIVEQYELRPDELRILEDACRQADLIGRLEAELSKDGTELVVKGSQGQPVANPLVSEVRQHRATLRQLLATLKLPDENGESARSTAARAAANARWRRGA